MRSALKIWNGAETARTFRSLASIPCLPPRNRSGEESAVPETRKACSVSRHITGGNCWKNLCDVSGWNGIDIYLQPVWVPDRHA